MSNIIIFNKDSLIKEIETEAKCLGIPSGAAESFAKRAVESASKRLAKRKIITNLDLERMVGEELNKYNADLAYVYQNRDKIF